MSKKMNARRSDLEFTLLPTHSHITHSISSSHLQLESLSRRVMVLQRMQC